MLFYEDLSEKSQKDALRTMKEPPVYIANLKIALEQLSHYINDNSKEDLIRKITYNSHFDIALKTKDGQGLLFSPSFDDEIKGFVVSHERLAVEYGTFDNIPEVLRFTLGYFLKDKYKDLYDSFIEDVTKFVDIYIELFTTLDEISSIFLRDRAIAVYPKSDFIVSKPNEDIFPIFVIVEEGKYLLYVGEENNSDPNDISPKDLLKMNIDNSKDVLSIIYSLLVKTISEQPTLRVDVLSDYR